MSCAWSSRPSPRQGPCTTTHTPSTEQESGRHWGQPSAWRRGSQAVPLYLLKVRSGYLVTQGLSPWSQKKSGKGFPAISETKSRRSLGQWRLASKEPQAEGVRQTGQPRGPLWVKTKGREGSRAPLEAQIVKDLHAVLETWVRFLGQEDPLEKEMATHSSFLAWRLPWAEEPGGLQFMGSQRVQD